MPTPFNHLVMAASVLRHPGLEPSVRRLLEASRPAFLFGNTAPDYVTLSGEARVVSHLFEVPMRDRRPAPELLLGRHPELADPQSLTEDQAAFVAGYLAHLWTDQAWITFVFEPRFGPAVERGTFPERLLEHNLLRAAWDLEDQSRLEPDVAQALGAARPSGWLPFAADPALAHWRDDLVRQLSQDEPDTLAVFAARHSMPAEDFAARLGPPPGRDQTAFAHLPRARLAAFIRLVEDRSRRLVDAYLRGVWADDPACGGDFLQLPSPRTMAQPA